ncbi:hypothetical protein L195_g021983 [Trifolium pratense]|uniref:Uncharacterized protein n=1 Tax=Trifolium pratense TaxID=57577 RepID=A0A2K3N6S9_TRIPR|nr:hypothetical protein L195_g021983 [Trifolium pratense]
MSNALGGGEDVWGAWFEASWHVLPLSRVLGTRSYVEKHTCIQTDARGTLTDVPVT